MIKPSINEVLNKIDNRYYLVGTVAKRAREIIDGSAPYVENKQKETKPVCIATQEVAEGEITYRILTQSEIEQAELEEKQEQEAAKKEIEE
ncbi:MULTISPECIES: DNA-directed RNA polymerase subunit omega [unclassified Romboutsia]|uniref:DNA-directed RNA polymerase subunit omega n=1 Tax=unclassified Romboutsia TaxID=2626894 RepID=UPI000820CD8E|nr:MULTISPECIES: DNA-directed RNA polymerase subunit omega [unclassified Romboutsia]SCH13546.1 DNA-directed RNA polymerase subunit omega [uncultured Clostridium sp.]